MSIKSILIVSEAFEIGGLETHIRGEIIELTALGWAVHFACGNRYNDQLMPDCVASITPNLNLDPDATVSGITDSVEKLRTIIRDHSIEYVHAHPFTSFFPAQTAAELENIKFIVTLHGPASLNSYCGPVYDFLLNEVTFKSSQLVIAISEEVKQLAYPLVLDQNLYLQPNTISFPEKIQVQHIESNWLVVSRLDWEKIPGVYDFIHLANSAGLGKIKIAGDGEAKEYLIQLLTEKKLIHTVEFLGFQTQISDLIHNSKGVVGMGRVVLEGLSHDKPVILIGYNNVKGLLDFASFLKAASFNFSGRNLPDIYLDAFKLQMQTYDPTTTQKISQYLRENYEASAIWKEFEKRILQINTTSKSILVDLHHYILSNIFNNLTPFFRSQVIVDTLGKLVQSEKYNIKTLSTAFYYCYTSFARKIDTYYQQQIDLLQSELERKNSENLEKSKDYENKIQELVTKYNDLKDSEKKNSSFSNNLQTELIKNTQLVEKLELKAQQNDLEKIQFEHQLNSLNENIHFVTNKNNTLILENDELKSRLTELLVQIKSKEEKLNLLISENELLESNLSKQKEITNQLITENEKYKSIHQELVNSSTLKALKILKNLKTK